MITKGPCNRLVWLLASMVLSSAAAGWASADPSRDPKAEEIAHAMMQAMGGVRAEGGWNAARVVRFDFKVSVGGKLEDNRSHLWDKPNGRYRLEETLKGGKVQVVLFSVADDRAYKQGSVYLDGKKVEGAEAQKALEDAYGAFINDMYWLAMPWKWLDPGVHLKYLGTKTRGPEADDVVELTFDHVGLTPGDRYRAFVSQKSHLMTHWEYVLQDGEKGAWDWQYGDYNGIRLASNHTSPDHKMSINMGDVRILDAVDGAFFADPAHMLSGLK